MPITLPVTQKRLTNVAIVRLKTHGKRFEIAAYKNKVMNWREGIEKDINEVLQVITVFTNVSKGEVAKDKDLKAAFNSIDQEEICRKILKSGDLQVSDRERELQIETIFRDVVQFVVERCIHPQSGRQHTPSAVENALKTIGFSVNPEIAAKRQALKAIEALCNDIPESFARAKMRLRISCPDTLRSEVREHIVNNVDGKIEEDQAGGEGSLASFTFVCGPNHYRDLDRLCTVTHKDQDVTLHVVCNVVLGEAVEKKGPAAASADASAAAPAAGGAEAAAAAASSAAAPTTAAAPLANGYPNPGEADGPRKAPMTNGAAPKGAAGGKKTMKCSTCQAEFEDPGEYRTHCRSDWHNFNLKRKVKSLPPLSMDDFTEMSLDVKEGFQAVDD
mmetsp:Transcript_6857/g.9785  ORF Transcript_6857/g.9785 Transcript_6857/m.9785 type:complete len:389 (+) Transcript_6857:144-1310(+)